MAEEEKIEEAKSEEKFEVTKENVKVILDSLGGNIKDLNVKDFRKMYEEKYPPSLVLFLQK